MIGSFRLPTHSRDAHRKFFDDPFLNQNQNFRTVGRNVPVRQ